MSVTDIILLIHKYHFSDLIIFWKYYYIFKKTHFLPSPEVKMNSWHSATKWNIWHKTFLLSLKCHSSGWFCLSYATDLFCLHVKCNINPHTEKLSRPYSAVWKKLPLKKKKKKKCYINYIGNHNFCKIWLPRLHVLLSLEDQALQKLLLLTWVTLHGVRHKRK